MASIRLILVVLLAAAAFFALPAGAQQYTLGGRKISEKQYQAVMLFNEAAALSAKGDSDKAMDKLAQSIALDPAFAESRTNYGILLLKAGRIDEALEHLEKAVGLKPDLAAAWQALGSCQQMRGEFPAAIEALKSYLRLSPNAPDAQQVRSIVAALENEQRRTGAGALANADDYLADAGQNGLARWPAKRMPIRVYIVPGDSVPDYRPVFAEILKQAFAQWAYASSGHVSFAYVDSPGAADIECSWTNDRNKMLIATEGGHAMVIPDGSGIRRATIILLTVAPTSGKPMSEEFARRVALHEIGHALGILGHSRNPKDIMFSSMLETEKESSLSDRDRKTIVALYTVDQSRLTARPLDLNRLMMSGDPSSPVAKVIKLNYEASQAMQQRNYNLAAEKLEAAMKLDPANAMIRANLGSVLSAQAAAAARAGDYTRAEELCRRGISLLENGAHRENLMISLRNYAGILRKLKRNDEAFKIEQRLEDLESAK